MSVTILCGWCSAPVVDKRLRKGMPMLYCTDKCRWTASNHRAVQRKRDRIVPKTLVCSECQAEFVVSRTSPRALTCSKECQAKRRSRRDRAWEAEHKEHVRHNARINAARRQADVKPPNWTPPTYTPTACVVCGQVYKPVMWKQRSCSKACGKQAAKQKVASWWQTNRAEANAKYGSAEHLALREQRREERKRLQDGAMSGRVGHCMWCGDDAMIAPDDPYCSDECRWEDAAERQRGAS
jgi:hypothetical protein